MIIRNQPTEMCSVIGCYLESPTAQQISLLKKVFVESRIRGKHATGYSVYRGQEVGEITTVKEPVSAEKFVESYFERVEPGDYVLQLIGHTRYSTSDLRYNQPIQVFDDSALAHNGVVDQRPSTYWQEYGYELSTANDSELLYHCSYSGEEPLLEFPESSMAVAELSAQKGLRWYRNGKRPLYHSKVENGWFICSTADIAKRAGLTGAKRCKPGVIYTPFGHKKIAKIEELI